MCNCKKHCPKAIVTLVHGTFSRNAQWIFNKESIIQKAIKTEFGDDVIIDNVEWSGKNSHRDRIDAGYSIARHLNLLSEKYPSVPRFIVAHSHGGNAALYALRNCSANSLPSGIVTMGTPFIHCEKRNINNSAIILRIGLAFLSGWFSLCALLYIMLIINKIFIYRILDNDYWVPYYFSLFIVIGIIIPVAIGIKTYRNFPKIIDKIAAKQQDIVGIFKHMSISVPILCIIVKGDEAKTWLSAIKFVAEQPFSIWNRWILLLVFLSMSLFSYFTLVTNIGQNKQILICLISLFSATAAILYAAVFWQLIMLIFPKIIRSHRLAYGGEKFFYNWLCRIYADVSPELDDDVVKIIEYRSPKGYKRLNHSWMYNDETVVAELSKWIKSNANMIVDG